MNEKVLKTLEYDKIIDKLTACATSPQGKALCAALTPSSDLARICQLQMETSDALARVYARGSLSLSGVSDIRPSLLRLKVDAPLGAAELLRVASLLEAALRAKTYGRRESDAEQRDCLDPFFDALEPLSPLCQEIRRCLLSEDEIADDASPGLKNVRRQIRLTNERVHQQLTSMVNSADISSKLQDSLITMRGGRYCLPVKAEYRSQIQGMIHDQSSSGSTLFIEPMAVVKLNNELRELDGKEKEEIAKVLADLSRQCGEHADLLETDLRVLTQLDFIFARAVFSRSYKGTEPRFNEDGRIHIKKARHPLLNPKTVVPIDITLGEDYRLLLVTGPNTGGKTVSLKTVGLLTLMGQSGLHIPAFDQSELAVFDQVYADIGDEQSIEQSLSTFSSHMTNIISIIDQSDNHSLVLLDELCAGTDPTEGAALAMSILKNFLIRGVTVMATTHYSELKVFALSTQGACNACCEFDVATLSPTYRLLIGIPGKSNAFAISSKLGLPAFMIEDARKYLSAADQSFEDLLADLETSRSTIEKEREDIQNYKKEIARLKEKLEARQENLSRQKENILRDANEKARKILQDAKDYADQTIRDMNKLAAGKSLESAREMEKKRSAVRERLNKLEDHPSPKAAASVKNRPEDFHPGDSVRVISMNLKGIVTSRPDSSGKVAVQMGILKSMVDINDLELLDEEVIKAPTLKKTGAGKIKMSKSLSVNTSLNLIGKTTAEAIPELDKYLDDAYLAHLKQVTIIHGRGTGKLRAAVHARLKKCRYVKSFRLGTFGEGETGVTIVDFH